MERIGATKWFEGEQLRFRHDSRTCGGPMTFSIYLPPATGPVPVLWWLSGLTCTDENFVLKAGAQRYAAQHGLAIVCPDTSPRGDDVPGDPDGAWDFGHGAGFWLDATEEPWRRRYRMHAYVTEELPELVFGMFDLDPGRQGISGHSMGGHGALVLSLRHPTRYRSVSALAPIGSPSEVPWGQKAFSRYLGPDRERWRDWDACQLIPRAHERLPILVDQGTADPYLETELRPERLEAACRAAGHPLELRRQVGYDHGYSFVSTFIGDHVGWHARALAP